MSSNGWVGVDLDGTLAQYDSWVSAEHVGEPVGAMLFRVRKWLADGVDVRIFTARVYPLTYVGPLSDTAPCAAWHLPSGYTQDNPRVAEAIVAAKAIMRWCIEHFGRTLPITSQKDYSMRELWDDRAVQVEPNTGRRVDGKN